MTDRTPCRDQFDRDRLADHDLPDLDDRVGLEPDAVHVEALMPS